MALEETLLKAIATDPGDDYAWLALADCLEEQSREREAELTRLRESLRKAKLGEPGRQEREQRIQALLAEGVLPVTPRLEIELAADVSLTFCLIPPGSFWMGSPLGESNRFENEGPRHLVHLTHGFWMGQTPLTVQQWHVLQGSRRPRGRPDRPAWGMSWIDLHAACVRLRKQTGRLFRLPTEAEWEYACRATTYSPYHTGSTKQDAHRAGWHQVGRRTLRRPVARKLPNAWGLYDVHGSVWEWCLDAMRTYGSDPVRDPLVRLFDGDDRSLRGGSMENQFHDSRSACRGWAESESSANHWGARLLIALHDVDSVARLFSAE